MQRCPICRARLRDQSQCPRCGADLALPQLAEKAARVHEQQALKALLQGEPGQAHHSLKRAIRLKQNPNQPLLAALIQQQASTPQAPAPTPQRPDQPEIPPILPQRWWF
jgi:hypothetical protein